MFFFLLKVREELESLDLENAPLEYPDRFKDWRELRERNYNFMRSL